MPHDRPATDAALQLIATSGTFALAYSLCNLLTGSRSDVGGGVFEWERSIPFVPWTIVPYLSIAGFFALSFFVGGSRAARQDHVRRLLVDLGLSIGCYLAFPLRFMFERPLSGDAWALPFALLSACDLPYNRAPSLHISVLLLLWLRLVPLASGHWRLLLQGWFVLIGASVLTTYQHHVIDIPAGLAAGALSAWIIGRCRARPTALMLPRLAAAWRPSPCSADHPGTR